MAINIGIIGAGTIGTVHTQTFKRNGITVLCLADIIESKAKALAEREGVPRAVNSAAKLLAMKDISAVVVAVPNKFHKPLAIAALNAGKDVFLEKPMALNVAECRAINDAARKNKRILQIGFAWRYSPAAVTAKRFIDAGDLGRLYHVKANIYRRRGIPGLGGWFTTKSVSGGGPLIDVGVHIIDLACYLMDFPRPRRVSGKVYANFGTRMRNYVYEGMWAGPPNFAGKFDVEDSAHALVRFDGGLTMELNAAWAGNFPENSVNDLMGFFGDKGGLSFTLGSKTVKLATERHGHNVDLAPTLRDAELFDEQCKTFVRGLETRQQPHATGERGQVVQSIIDAVYESSRKDREVEVKGK